ncbi:MAG: hypothetical protein PHU42_03820 [Patescibacteria group bacterium]|nr:hypothetical protein [Patescibacteria group bacterium]
MKNKKKVGEKLVFTIIIVIFALSSVLAYASFSMKAPPPPLITPEAQKEAKTAKELDSKGLKLNQNLTGVIHKLEPGISSEGTHYIEASGITLAILEADAGINLDNYIDKNVSVWGDSRATTGGDGAIMKVKKVEVSS